MIASVRGQVLAVTTTTVVVECGGIGYEIQATASVLGLCPAVGEEIMVYTYLQVREDGIALFGFSSADEKTMFEKLISVNGVGPKGALAVLSFLGAEGLRVAIFTEDAKLIAKAPTIGNKTAQKIILELKDKVDMTEIAGPKTSGQAPVGTLHMTGAVQDVCMALTALGFREAEALAAVKSVSGAETMDADSLLTAALKKLG